MMEMQANDGYFENGHLYKAGRVIDIPAGRRVYVKILDEPIVDNNAEQFHKLLDDMRNEAEKRGFMNDDEINVEIQAARAEIKARGK